MNRTICRTVLLAICLMGLVNCATPYRTPPAVPPVEAITAMSATPLSYPIGKSFGPLVAMVTTNGSPATGVVVTFKAPTTGATGTFANTGTGTTTTKTDSSGLATSAVFTANATAGSYTVVASTPGAASLADFSLTNSTGAPAVILATSGSAQSAAVRSPFAAPFVVTVQDSGQNPVSGAIVVFQAPAKGPSGTFAGAANPTMPATTTATSDANGVATSAAFTANTTAGNYTVIASVGMSATVNLNLTNLPGPPAVIVATSPLTPQSASINTPFLVPFVATVLDSNSNPVSGVAVTFSAPTTAASGTFANNQTTETDSTNASGIATSSTFRANGTAGTYVVTATLPSGGTPANFSLTNRVASNTYVFYLSGQELSGNFYTLAGSVEIDPSGNILAGEQDFNDAAGLTSPQPSGDAILSGTAALVVDPTTGQGTLILTTNNPALGVPDGKGNGIETLGVQFVNSNHALIIQFDGTTTSSGSLDQQTLPSSLDGGYAFTLSGLDPSLFPVAFGGVFSISGTALQNGKLDTNDAGSVTPAAPLSGTLSSLSGPLFDSFGRGTITSSIMYSVIGTPVVLNYYVVGPEVMRIIDVDSTDSAIGSAFGQGVNATSASNTSLGNSVFGIAENSNSTQFGAAGMFTTNSSSATFSGIADDNELTFGVLLPASPISGSYSITSNGYGTLTITSGNFGDVSALGIYMTDPNLNLRDPNNTTSGLGGAVAADMDSLLAGGTGILIPETDTSAASFIGNYAFGAQAINSSFEFDFIGQGSVTGLALSGNGLLSDPFITLGASTTNQGVMFSGTPLPDASNAGRYTMLSTNPTPNPLAVTISGTPINFDVVIYQASGGQLLWLNEDPTSVFLGSLQQQGSLTGLPAARKPAPKARRNRNNKTIHP
jgi:hypothetical protein